MFTTQLLHHHIFSINIRDGSKSSFSIETDDK